MMITANGAIPATVRKHNVMLVEDHPVFLHGLTMLIDDEPDLHVCGAAETVVQAHEMIRQLNPDVLVVDITLGEQSGLDLIKQLHEQYPQVPILALSMHDESLYAERALRAGAMGYIMKKEAMDRVMTAIRRVLSGEIYVSETMASRVVHRFIHPSGGKAGSPLEALSDREFEVFQLIASGIGPTEIARRLEVSVKTIETHREHIKHKLNLKNGAELIRFAIEWTMDRR